MEKSLQEKINNLGLNCREFSVNEITELSQDAEKKHVRKFLNEREYIVPELEQLFLVRTTDVFPQNSVIVPVSSSARTSPYDFKDEEIILDRLTKEVCEKYGISGVNSRKELQKIKTETNQEIILKIIEESRQKAVNEYGVRYKSIRDTVHFTMNALVADNNGGSWKDMPFVFIEPYKHHQGEFDNIGSYDSWKTGNFRLKQPTLLVNFDNLENLIEIAKNNSSVLNTLKNCEIMLTDSNENVKLDEFVRAVIHEKGAPAYFCKSMTSTASNSREHSVGADGLHQTLSKLAEQESTDEKEVTFNELHANSMFEDYENKAMTCQMYNNLLMFSKFVAKKLNNPELLTKLEQFDMPRNKEALTEFCSAYYEKVNIEYEEYMLSTEGLETLPEGHKETVDAFNSKIKKISNSLRTINKVKPRAMALQVKDIFIDEIEQTMKPFLMNMPAEQLKEYIAEFNKNIERICEAVFGKSIVFKKDKTNEKTFVTGENQLE